MNREEDEWETDDVSEENDPFNDEEGDWDEQDNWSDEEGWADDDDDYVEPPVRSVVVPGDSGVMKLTFMYAIGLSLLLYILVFVLLLAFANRRIDDAFVGVMFSAPCLALFVTPMIYAFITHKRRRLEYRFRKRKLTVYTHEGRFEHYKFSDYRFNFFWGGVILEPVVAEDEFNGEVTPVNKIWMKGADQNRVRTFYSENALE